MSDSEYPTGNDPAQWEEARRLAYSAHEAESIFRSLVRQRAHEEADDTQVDQAIVKTRTVKAWLDCDPEGRVLAEVYAERVGALERFHNRLTPGDRSTPSSYPALSRLHAKLRGRGELRTPQGREPVGRDWYWRVAEDSSHEIYETVARVFADGSTILAAARASMKGRYGWSAGCLEDDEHERKVDYVSRHASRLIYEEGLTENDLPYVRAVWRRELRIRLLAFARFEALARALDDYERGEFFSLQDLVVPASRGDGGAVTLGQAEAALAILEVLRGLTGPVKSYEDLGRQVELSDNSDDSVSGRSVVKSAERALKRLGERPTPSGLADLLSQHEAHFRNVVMERRADSRG